MSNNELPLTNGVIGIDYTSAHEQSAGIGRLVRDLISALVDADRHTRYKLFVAGATKSQLLSPLGDNFRWKPTRVTPHWFARLWYKTRVPLPVEAFIGPVDLYHATDFTLPPTLPGTKTILTVHDLSYVRTPDVFPPVLKAYLDRAVPWSVKRADHIIADSQATKDDLTDTYGTPPDKITVLLSGVNPLLKPVANEEVIAGVLEHYDIPPDVPYLFCIGTVQPRKNYARVMEALAALGPAYSDLHLIIAGGTGWLENPIFDKVEELNLAERVHFTGYVQDQEVPALYSGALCTVFTSLYEGFGFPVLESMACGTPVITSNVSSLPEVAGNAAIMVDPYDVEAIANALQQVLNDKGRQEQMVQAGFEQVKHFTWGKSARRLLQIYREVLTRS